MLRGSLQVLIEHLVSGEDAAPPHSSTPVAVPAPQPTAAQWGAQTADAVLAPGNSPQLSAGDLLEEERQLEMAMRASLAMVAQGGGGDGGGAHAPARRSAPGSAMDPAHTFRTLVIEMLRGDPSARQDLVKAFDDLNKGEMFQSPRLLYFLLEHCKMDKLSKLPENIVTMWMGYLQRAPPQPALRDLIVIEGQLGKQGSKKWDTKGWKMKWFVMTDSFLCYYNKLSDKNDGKEPRKQVALSAVIRLQMVAPDISGSMCSFEIITEQDHPNWKVHAAISEDHGESELYYFKWQSAIEEAVRGARDLDRAFVNAKSAEYWADVDARLQSSGPAANQEESSLPRQVSQASSDGFDPRDQGAVEVEAPTEQDYDPFAVETPRRDAPDLISDLLGADTSGGLASHISSTDPFGSIDWSTPADPAPSAAFAPAAAPAAVSMPVMTPSPMQAAAFAASPALPASSAPMYSAAASNPFRTEPSANPFAASSPPAVSAPGWPSPGQPQGSGDLVSAQARGFDGAINSNLFDAQAAKAPVANPFAPPAGNTDALKNLRAAAKPIPGPTAGSNPFAKLENDAWSQAAARSPPKVAAVPVAKVAPAPAPAVRWEPSSSIRLHVCWCRRHARGTSDTLCVLCFLRVVQPQPEAMPAEAPPSPWDSVGAAPAPVPTPVVAPQQAPSAQASPWDSVGTRGGAPTPVMPAQADEMKKAAAAKATANSDLF